jgi:hypothetical protein
MSAGLPHDKYNIQDNYIYLDESRSGLEMRQLMQKELLLLTNVMDKHFPA